jgi:enoyl-CoA hydratase/carnithine racemase
MQVRVELERPIATVTIAHPPVNALSWTVRDELTEALRALGSDPGVSVVVLTGDRGARDIFSAGADINEFELLNDAAPGSDWAIREMQWIEYVLTQRLPIVAAVNGAALGGGLELVLACDIVLAASRATFAFPEIGLGAFPANYALTLAARLLGPARARWLALTAEVVDAEWMLRAGVVSEVVERERLVSRAQDVARQVAAQSHRGVRATREVMQTIASASAGELRLTLLHTDLVYRSPEMQEQMRRFLEARRSRGPREEGGPAA